MHFYWLPQEVRKTSRIEDLELVVYFGRCINVWMRTTSVFRSNGSLCISFEEVAFNHLTSCAFGWKKNWPFLFFFLIAQKTETIIFCPIVGYFSPVGQVLFAGSHRSTSRCRCRLHQWMERGRQDGPEDSSGVTFTPNKEDANPGAHGGKHKGLVHKINMHAHTRRHSHTCTHTVAPRKNAWAQKCAWFYF